MSEQASNLRPEEPDTYVDDPHKAEIMAYASKGAEEQVVKARGRALIAADNIGNENYRSQYNRGAQHEAGAQAQAAEEARQLADKQVQAAPDVYDRVKKL